MELELELYKDIVANVFNRRGWEYSLERNDEQYRFGLNLRTDMAGNIECTVLLGRDGRCDTCTVYVEFKDAICPEDKIIDMCYLITQLNENIFESDTWHLDVKTGEIFKMHRFNFTMENSQFAYENFFEKEFDDVICYIEEDLEAILRLCKGLVSPEKEGGNDGIKMRF